MICLGTCMVQSQLEPQFNKKALERELAVVVKSHVGQATRLLLSWMVIDEGCGFSAGKTSGSTVLQLSVPTGFDQTKREALMHALSARWCSITGQSPYQLMVAVVDREQSSKTIAVVLKQLPLMARIKMLAQHVRQLLNSWLVTG